MSADYVDVFLSSQIAEFENFRKYIKNKINKRNFLNCTLLEQRGASPYNTTSISLRKVRNADLLVGLVGKNESSITRAEIREAIKKDKPCFFYIKETKSRDEKMNVLISESIKPYGKYSEFKNQKELCKQILKDLNDYMLDLLKVGLEQHKNQKEKTIKHEEKIRKEVKSHPDKYHLKLLKQARDSYGLKDYLSTIIKSSISLEVWLRTYLNKTHSDDKYFKDKYEKKTFGYLIHYAEKIQLLKKRDIGMLIEVRILRNDSVHTGKTPSQASAQFALSIAESIFDDYPGVN